MPQEFPFPPPQGQSLVVGNATPAEVLAGATFSSQAAGIGAVGTMPNRGSPTLQPGQTIPPGYYSGGQVAPGGILLDVPALVTGSGTTEALVVADVAAARPGVVEALVITDVPAPSTSDVDVVEVVVATGLPLSVTETVLTDQAARTTGTGTTEALVADVASGQQAVTEPFPITDSAAQA